MAVSPSHFPLDLDSIRYQARTKLASLGGEYVAIRRLESPEAESLLAQMARIRLWLRALDCPYIDNDIQFKIAYQLIEFSEIYSFPTAPILSPRSRPNVLIGGGGNVTNITNNYNAGTPFINSTVTGTETADTFPISLSTGCVFNYTITDGTNQRTGLLIATWLSDGSLIDCSEQSSPDLGDTSDITLNVDISSGMVRLRATTSSTYSVSGTRYLV